MAENMDISMDNEMNIDNSLHNPTPLPLPPPSTNEDDVIYSPECKRPRPSVGVTEGGGGTDTPIDALPIAPSMFEFFSNPVSMYRPNPEWFTLCDEKKGEVGGKHVEQDDAANHTTNHITNHGGGVVLESMVLGNGTTLEGSSFLDDPAPSSTVDVSMTLNFTNTTTDNAQVEDENGGGDDGPNGNISSIRRKGKYPKEHPLHTCARLNMHKHLSAILSQFPTIPTSILTLPNPKGITPLCLSSQKGSLEVTELLIKAGADVNYHPPNGSTPLIQASHFGHEEVCKLLISHGSAVDMPNGKGTTALMRASQEGNFNIVRLLCSHSASVSKVNSEHMSCLMLACQRGHVEIVDYFCRIGGDKADIDGQTIQASTALMLATKRGHRDVVMTLLKYGANMDIMDNRHRTPLENARKRQYKMVEECLDVRVQELLERRRFREDALRYYVWFIKLMDEGKWKVEVRERVGRGEKVMVDAVEKLPTSIVYYILQYVRMPNVWGERLKKCRKMLTKVTDLISVHSPTSQKLMDRLLTYYFTLIESVLTSTLDICGVWEEGGVKCPEGFGCWGEWGKVRNVVEGMEEERVKRIV
eukprot:CAMPEP_0118645720 /NCGR_PEP_ID=MMETSP0785-20121206/7656_1 /TAXON_ID=91992 /ORGANISM="Bolidomonas pacifica, Strain CCMP 1866" /LENGTH=585 /DNA_ID=CAMNT_0006537631 /DNA_START=61 /DNA_END=1814 /DNA_ORIENTATION=+